MRAQRLNRYFHFTLFMHISLLKFSIYLHTVNGLYYYNNGFTCIIHRQLTQVAVRSAIIMERGPVLRTSSRHLLASLLINLQCTI